MTWGTRDLSNGRHDLYLQSPLAKKTKKACKISGKARSNHWGKEKIQKVFGIQKSP